MVFFQVYYGEFLVLAVLGMVLAIARRAVFGAVCREADAGGNKGRMLKAMSLKFSKSYEIHVGIYDRRAFVEKYLAQEKRLGISLLRWRRLPERWTGLILCIGFLEAVVMSHFGILLGYCLERIIAAIAAASAVMFAALWFESDSFWERCRILLMDYVSNTLYPRQIHEYEEFEQAEENVSPKEESEDLKTVKKQEKKEEEKKPSTGQLKKEEEELFQEVLSDILGLPTS